MINTAIQPNSYQNTRMPHSAGNTKLSIFYINDMHGNIDNMSGMIAASDKFDKMTDFKGTDTLKISAGDNFSGSDTKKNKLVINLLSRMGIEYSAVGNHEFDSTLTKFYSYLNPNKTKFLAANAKTPENSPFYQNIQKSDIIEVNGNKYGLVGLLPFDLETVMGADDSKMEGVRVENLDKSVEIVNEEVKKLQAQGVDKIILVSHIGNDKDKIIAPRLHGVDIIVGGHTHTEVKDIKQGENLLNNADGEPILIVQTGENARNVGILNVEFNENGVPVAAENNLIRTNQQKTVVTDYYKDSVMGKSPEVGKIAECEPLPVNRRATPCAWTNFVCDAIRNQTGVDIAFINAANIRKTPKTGSLTERDISETAPMKNTMLVKKMTEKEVVRAIQDALNDTFSKNKESNEPGILHTSGLSYRADVNANLLELNFIDKNGNKIPIDVKNPTDKMYTVCYDSFIAAGTEYPVFVPETMTDKEILQKFDFDKDKLAIEYLKTLPDKENLKIKDDGRIVILDNTGKPLSALEDNSTSLNKTASAIKSEPSGGSLSKIRTITAIQGYGNAMRA